MRRPPRIAIVGDHDPAQATHAALDLAAAGLAHGIQAGWVPTEDLADDASARLADANGLWIAPASPYRSFDGVLGAIRHARERGVPLFAT
jgi:CTP synthase